jgi:hypothetical protein
MAEILRFTSFQAFVACNASMVSPAWHRHHGERPFATCFDDSAIARAE